jgi:hypothetical protein
MNKLLIGVVITLFFSSCSHSVIPSKERVRISMYTQDAMHYLGKEPSALLLKPKVQNAWLAEYKRQFFSPWLEPYRFVKARLMWPWSVYVYPKGYGLDLLPYKKEWYEKLRTYANLKKYPSLNQKAITLGNTHLRNYPTQFPLFYDPSKAGEGFPFDYLQNSMLHVGEPVRITHKSIDSAWIFVESAQADGWIRANEVVTVDTKTIQKLKNSEAIILTQNEVALYDLMGKVITTGNLGARFSLLKEDAYFWHVNIVKRDIYNSAFLETGMIMKEQAVRQGIAYSAKNIANYMNKIMGRSYGWGGLYCERDCSSTIRDIFAPFGLWLPRNSSKQRTSGKFVKIEKSDLVLKTLKEEALPYQTLINFEGHVGLYLGEYKGEPLLFHTLWGLRTFDGEHHGRVVIAKSVVSSLYAGKTLDIEHPNGLLDRVIGLTYIGIK